jgi:hypothetical protein
LNGITLVFRDIGKILKKVGRPRDRKFYGNQYSAKKKKKKKRKEKKNRKKHSGDASTLKKSCSINLEFSTRLFLAKS